jgi:hypothetical protein
LLALIFFIIYNQKVYTLFYFYFLTIGIDYSSKEKEEIKIWKKTVKSFMENIIIICREKNIKTEIINTDCDQIGCSTFFTYNYLLTKEDGKSFYVDRSTKFEDMYESPSSKKSSSSSSSSSFAKNFNAY